MIKIKMFTAKKKSYLEWLADLLGAECRSGRKGVLLNG